MYRKIKLFLSAVILLLLVSSNIFAQRYSGFASPGTLELGGNISLSSNTPVVNGDTRGSTTTFSLMPFVGVFLTDGFELGFNPFGITSTEGTTSILMLLAPSYNFRTGSIAYPFIEGLLGFASVSGGSTASGFSWGLRGGVKLALGGNSLLNIGLEYLQVSTNPSGATERYGYNQIAFSTGFTVWF